MSVSWRVAWLSWAVGVAGLGASGVALAAEGVPGGGFPAEEVEFLVVSPGHGLCLSRAPSPAPGPSPARGVGRPCEWEAPDAGQRWRYQAGRLVNVESGECLLGAALGPCAAAASESGFASEFSYELLLQRLVWRAPRAAPVCVGVEGSGRQGSAGDGPAGLWTLGLFPLDARECGAEHVASKWMLVPLGAARGGPKGLTSR